MALYGRHARHTKAAIAIPTETKMPATTPTNATAARQAIDNANSDRRSRYNRTTPATSTRDRLAAMTTAARTDEGRSASSAGANRSSRTISPAPTSPATWLRTPDDIATDVRDALALTEKPDSTAEPRFAAPSATNSASACERSPSRAASVRDSTDVSAIDTSAIATAPANSVVRSSSGIDGIVGRGRPGGSAPTTGTF